MQLGRGKGLYIMYQFAITILIIVLTLVSGWGDANGDVHLLIIPQTSCDSARSGSSVSNI